MTSEGWPAPSHQLSTDMLPAEFNTRQMGQFHVPKREMTVLVYFLTQFQPSPRACLSKSVFKNFGTAEFTSQLKNTFYCLKMANLVLQTPNTGKQ